MAGLVAPTALENYFLSLVNNARANAGLVPLTFDGELLAASDAHSTWMDATDTFSHIGVNGSDPGQRMTAAGYGWSGYGENVAYVSGPATQAAVDQLFQNLMNSPPHRANILNSSFQEIGIGLQEGAINGHSAVFVTQNFGIPNAAEQAEPHDAGTGALTGSIYNDVLIGSAAADTIFSGLGNDVAEGGLGNDLLFGGQGNDSLYGGDNADQLYGAQGDDVLSGGAGDDQVYGSIGRDTVYGGGGNDLVSGLRDDDLLYAGEGSDTIWSGAGNDIAYGGAGNDVIYGSLGNDRFYGEAGADTFIFEAGWGVDEIVGFSFLEGDRIALAGQSYSIRDTAEGMALDLSGGGSIVLHNIEPLAFSTAFLV